MEIKALQLFLGGLVTDVCFKQRQGLVETHIAVTGNVVERVIHTGKLPVEDVEFIAIDNQIGRLVVAVARHLPYLGMVLAQVVNHLHPERFVNDVPFMFGNQDSFSLFSPVIAQIFKVLGVNLGGTVATLVLELFWCIAALFLVDRWSEHFGMRKWALPIFCVFVVVFAFQTYACGGGEFPVIDTLLVARFLSENFALFALAFLFSKNRYASLVLFLVATSIHPLMCGWGIPLWLFFHFPLGYNVDYLKLPTIFYYLRIHVSNWYLIIRMG